jgi:hypothetical protein
LIALASDSPDDGLGEARSGRGRWTPRVVGLAIVLMSLMLFYGLTLPQLQERGVVVGIMCFWGVCGTLLGMPMLVTGRVRQKP